MIEGPKIISGPPRRQSEQEQQDRLNRLSSALDSLGNIGGEDSKKIREHHRAMEKKRREELGLSKEDLRREKENASREIRDRAEKKWQHFYKIIKEDGNTKRFGLSEWASYQRARYRAGKLREDKIKALESLPWWTWEKRTRTKESPV